LTGIGHDSNVSIVDLMARQHKTPTKAAAYIVDHNLSFDTAIEGLKERFFQSADDLIENAKNNLKELKRVVKSSSPATILNRGFAIVMSNDKIITDPGNIQVNTQINILLKNEMIHSTVTKKETHDKGFDI
jgi:exodeoxyribonuclease VII large subunit